MSTNQMVDVTELLSQVFFSCNPRDGLLFEHRIHPWNLQMNIGKGQTLLLLLALFVCKFLSMYEYSPDLREILPKELEVANLFCQMVLFKWKCFW